MCNYCKYPIVLSGGGVDDGGDDGGKSGGHGGKSISNRYRETGSALERNAATIARAQSFRDQEQNQRRELLQKRIEETRRKLQDVSCRDRGSILFTSIPKEWLNCQVDTYHIDVPK